MNKRAKPITTNNAGGPFWGPLVFIVMLIGFSCFSLAEISESKKTEALEEVLAGADRLSDLDEALIDSFGYNRVAAAFALKEIKKEVEDQSYMTTMRLCEGYRRFSDLGPILGLGRYLKRVHSNAFAKASQGHLSSSSDALIAVDNQPLHEKEEALLSVLASERSKQKVFIRQKNLRKQLKSDGYYFSTQEHVSSVVDISTYGFAAVFEGFYSGPKELHNQAYAKGMFEPSSMYGSVKMYYLLRSQGGLRAMVHCLGYDKRGDFRADRINDFMNYVGYLDGTGGVIGDSVIGGAVYKLFLAPVFKYIIKPVFGMVSRSGVGGWIGKLTSSFWKSGQGKMFVVGSMIIANDSLSVFVQEKITAMETAEEFLDKESPNSIFNSDELVNTRDEVRALSVGYYKYLKLQAAIQDGSSTYDDIDLELRKQNYEKLFNYTMVKRQASVIKLCRLLYHSEDQSKSQLATLDMIFHFMPQAKIDPKLCTRP